MKKLAIVLAAMFALSAVAFANEDVTTEHTATEHKMEAPAHGKKHGAKKAKKAEKHTEEKHETTTETHHE